MKRLRLLWAAALRLGGFVFLWWVLSEGALEDLPLVLLFALLGAGMSLTLLPPGSVRLRPLGLLQIIPHLLWGALLSGLDVARHALSPSLSVSPAVITLPLRLSTPTARAVFVWAVNLIPGTAVVELLEDRCTLHLLDKGQPTEVSEAVLRRLEARVARLFRGEERLS